MIALGPLGHIRLLFQVSLETVLFRYPSSYFSRPVF
uniref:Uncharacterized protein n=1 Tax=Anguilla anguilla TaxID=7936 RepID=A0A0E9UWF3_ANGAN